MVTIYYWCDGTWCHEENLAEYGWMSDDTIATKVPEAWTDEQIDTFVHNQI